MCLHKVFSPHRPAVLCFLFSQQLSIGGHQFAQIFLITLSDFIIGADNGSFPFHYFNGSLCFHSRSFAVGESLHCYVAFPLLMRIDGVPGSL